MRKEFSANISFYKNNNINVFDGKLPGGKIYGSILRYLLERNSIDIRTFNKLNLIYENWLTVDKKKHETSNHILLDNLIYKILIDNKLIEK